MCESREGSSKYLAFSGHLRMHVAFYYWPSALIREFIAILHERKHLIMTAIGYMIWMCPFIFALIYTLTAQM